MTWNLSSFDEIYPDVLTSVSKESILELPGKRKSRRNVRSTTVAGVASVAILVAAAGLVSQRIDVYGTDDALRLPSLSSISNVKTDRPPLTLLFGGRHSVKWDRERETTMLERAAAAMANSDPKANEANLVHSLLREELPADREHADDLSSLGIRLT